MKKTLCTKDGGRLEQHRKHEAKLGRRRREASLTDDEWQRVQQFIAGLRNRRVG